MMKNEKIVKNLLMGLLLICISVVGALIWINGGYEKEGLLQLGKKWEISNVNSDKSTEAVQYEKAMGIYLVRSIEEEIYFDVGAPKTNWKYCTIELSEVSRPYVIWEIELFNQKGKTLHKKSYVLHEGTNWVKVSANGKVKSMRIGISNSNQPWYTFKIDSITLNQKYVNFEDFLEKTVTFVLIGIVFCILIGAIKRLEWYFVIEVLQNIYICFGDFLGQKIALRIPENIRRVMLTCCFLFMFLLMPVMNVVSGESYDSMAQYWIYGYGILLFLSGMLCWNKPLQKLDWKNGVCLLWLLLWSMISIADLLVIKSFAYVGHIMVLCSGFAFFVWNNEKCFKGVLRCMRTALQFTLLPILTYCILFRQKKEGIFYNGCFLNHESMAMYMLAVLLAFLIEGNYLLKQKRLHFIKVMLCGMGAALSASLLYYSRTSYCMAAMLMVIVTWGIVQILNCWKYKRKIIEVILIAGVTLVLAVPVVLVVKYEVEVLPMKLKTEMVYPNEVRESVFPMEAVLEEVEGVVVEKEDERKDVWLSYLQKINLIGRKDNLRKGGTYINPSNGILQMAHRYGILILVPYLAILLVSIYTAITERKFSWLLTVLAFIILLVGENIEMPFTQPMWLMFYFGIGQFLGNKKKEDMRLEVTYENFN